MLLGFILVMLVTEMAGDDLPARAHTPEPMRMADDDHPASAPEPGAEEDETVAEDPKPAPEPPLPDDDVPAV